MRKEYDFSKGKKNPYASKLKKKISINVAESTLEYFKELSEETGMPYQNLMNLYLGHCAFAKKRPEIKWINPGHLPKAKK